MTDIYKILYNSLPLPYKKWLKQYLAYANFTISPERYAGFSIIYGLLLLISTTSFILIIEVSMRTTAIIVGLTVFLVFEAFMHSIIVLIADSRANFTEEILPDVLSLISSNIRSGLTPDKALMLAARSEFGPLEEEIKRAAKRMLSGEPIEEAIKVIPEKIKSKSLERTINLLSEGMAKGGSLQGLLDGLANDIREASLMRKEIAAQVMVYAIFIFFAVCIGAPVLLAVSSHLIQTMTTISRNINIDQAPMPTGQITFRIQKVNIDPTFLLKYSIVSLIINSIFGGILIGLIKDGSERAGIKYIPILMGISLGALFLARMVVFSFFTISPV